VGIFSFFGSSEKAIDIVDRRSGDIVSGLDKMFHTTEERAEVALKYTELHQEFVHKTASENTVRSITRRIIAKAIILYTLFFAVPAIVILKYCNKELGDFALEVAVAFNLHIAFITTCVFFFGNHVLNTYQAGKK
jgi:hypothetical protein